MSAPLIGYLVLVVIFGFLLKAVEDIRNTLDDIRDRLPEPPTLDPFGLDDLDEK